MGCCSSALGSAEDIKGDLREATRGRPTTAKQQIVDAQGNGRMSAISSDLASELANAAQGVEQAEKKLARSETKANMQATVKAGKLAKANEAVDALVTEFGGADLDLGGLVEWQNKYLTTMRHKSSTLREVALSELADLFARAADPAMPHGQLKWSTLQEVVPEMLKRLSEEPEADVRVAAGEAILAWVEVWAARSRASSSAPLQFSIGLAGERASRLEGTFEIAAGSTPPPLLPHLPLLIAALGHFDKRTRAYAARLLELFLDPLEPLAARLDEIGVPSEQVERGSAAEAIESLTSLALRRNLPGLLAKLGQSLSTESAAGQGTERSAKDGGGCTAPFAAETLGRMAGDDKALYKAVVLTLHVAEPVLFTVHAPKLLSQATAAVQASGEPRPSNMYSTNDAAVLLDGDGKLLENGQVRAAVVAKLVELEPSAFTRHASTLLSKIG